MSPVAACLGVVSFIRFTLILFFAAASLPVSSANRLPTKGLSIINSPPSGNPARAGSSIGISIEVSGDGKLPADAANPSSTASTHFNSIEIYLVSAATGLNLTVAAGTDFLTSQTGSVRQTSWPVPSCVPAGQYNLTFYEDFVKDGQSRFTITPVSIPVENNAPSGACTEGVNALQAQPQPSNPLDASPFGNEGTASPTPSRITTSFTSAPSGTPATLELTLTLTSGFDFPTITQTVTPTAQPTTIVIVSMETLTTTISGQQGVVTTVLTQTLTATAGTSFENNSGFIPVNGSARLTPCPMFSIIFSFVTGLVVVLFR